MTRTLRGLLCTHHLLQWGGSELVTLELAEELRSRGHEILLYAPFVSPELQRVAEAAGVTVLTDPQGVELAGLDFVYAQHQTLNHFLARMPPEGFLGPDRPFFVFAHLSPFGLFEVPGPFVEAALADLILCNSPETAAAMAGYGPAYAGAKLFANPAPQGFAGKMRQTTGLRRILSVSNHLPDEMAAALDLLEAQGIKVTRLGRPGPSRRLLPEDLAAHDAVVTNGKTVQYAMRARRPVFCYDTFAGPGWLTPDTFDAAARQNFSGRSHPQARDAGTLAAEIVEGFKAGREAVKTWTPALLAPYRLEDQVDLMLQAVTTAPRRPAPGVDTQEGAADFARKIWHESQIYALVEKQYRRASKTDELQRNSDELQRKLKKLSRNYKKLVQKTNTTEKAIGPQ